MGKHSIKIDYTVQIWKEGAEYVAHAMPLDVMSCGATTDEARKALDEAVTLFLRTADEMGVLREILEEAGYDGCGDRWTSPAWVSVERHSLSVGA